MRTSRDSTANSDSGKVAIVATEMATNLVRHASNGELLIQIIRTGSSKILEMLSIDLGPGMADVSRCLQDGYSTGGTAGNGLGRNSDAFPPNSDIFSVRRQPEPWSSSCREFIRKRAVTFEISLHHRLPHQTVCSGETACGDAWQCSQSGHVFKLMVADGLGHGPLAEMAASAAVQVFESQRAADC